MAKRLDNETEARVICAYPTSRSISEVARIVGISEQSVGRILDRNGIARRDHYSVRLNDRQETELVYLHEQGQSRSELMRHFGISGSVVIRVLKRHDIKSRPRGGRITQKPPEVVSDLIERWKAGETQTAIGRRLGMTQYAVRAEILKAGLEPESRNNRKGRLSENWKGGRTQDVNGYWRVYLRAESPFVSMRTSMGYVMEHRLVMAQHIGRPLEWYESVQLRIGQHGRGAAFQCADCGSCNIVPIKIAESA